MKKIYNLNQYTNSNRNNTLDKLIKNKNLYFQLEQEDKYNYEIIKNIFILFVDDKEFLKKVYNDIVLNVKEDWIFEFSIRMLDIIKKSPTINLSDYINNPKMGIMASKETEINLFELDIGLRKMKILNIIENILKSHNYQKSSLGFAYIDYMFNYSEVILDFFAKHFISEIFLELNLEKYLHENFDNYEDFENKTNQKSFVLNHISSKDKDLAHYVINHTTTLEEIMYAFEYIMKAWELYIDDELHISYELIFNEIYEYIKLSKNSGRIQELWNIAYYASYTSGILEPFFHLAYGYDEEYLEMKKKEFEIYEQQNPNIDEMMDYLYFKKIINNSLNLVTDIGYKKKLKEKNYIY